MSDRYCEIKEDGGTLIIRPNNSGDVGDANDILDELNRLKCHIRRLEAAGDRMASLLKSTRQHWYSTDQCEVVAFDWNEAKEAKL